MNLSYNSGVKGDSGNSRNQDLNVPATTLTSIHRSSSISTSPVFNAAVKAFTLETEPGIRYNPTSSNPVISKTGNEYYYLVVQDHSAVCQQPTESLVPLVLGEHST